MSVRELNGRELAGYIKQRQGQAVRSLDAKGVNPKLVIIQTIDDPVIDTYVRMKRRYGQEIGVAVDIRKVSQSEVRDTIREANDDDSVHAMIVQLPLADMAETDEILALVSPDKDVDGLGPEPNFDPATATAILWLLAGYNIDLQGKKIAIIGLGRLVGRPLSKMIQSSGHQVVEIDKDTDNPAEKARECDIIVTATGVPRLVKNDWVAEGAVVVDAGTAGEKGVIVGDMDDSVRERTDLKAITPLVGGVGPLTVCALFENTIVAATRIS